MTRSPSPQPAVHPGRSGCVVSGPVWERTAAGNIMKNDRTGTRERTDCVIEGVPKLVHLPGRERKIPAGSSPVGIPVVTDLRMTCGRLLLPQDLIAVQLGEPHPDLPGPPLPGEFFGDHGLLAARDEFADGMIEV